MDLVGSLHGTHSSLKYQLLGPSLNKAGQDTVDQQKVSEVIYSASKGSKFFNHEETRDRNLTAKIRRLLEQKARLESLDLSNDIRRVDEYITALESNRDLSQTVVHIDCDAFYAAVEELDRPDLKTVPMAVGKGVITTCNYHARKFGCRSGMAAFVAKKLCPDLICLPQNFDKYNAKAKEIRGILAEYDPRFESVSIDEAYLNITTYCARYHLTPDAAVRQMRAEILDKTRISVSAGIAANAKIAKIASNRNKPNGQFYVPNNRAAIMAFMEDLLVRKVNGIGRVFERELDAIGIKTCGDIYSYRALLPGLFGEKAFQFLIRCYLGLGRTEIHPAEEYERKSVGIESTFSETENKQEIRAKLRWAAGELEKDLIQAQFQGRTLVLKVKLHTFEVMTRQTAPPRAVYLTQDLYEFGLLMLAKLEKDIPNMKLRLLGLRCTNLISTRKVDIDFFGVNSKPKPSKFPNEKYGERELNAEEEFEQASRQERHDDMNELEKLSQEMIFSDETRGPPGDILKGDTAQACHPKADRQLWDCPICLHPRAADDRTFNAHVDFCLSKRMIKEVARGSSGITLSTSSPPRKRKLKSPFSDVAIDNHQTRLAFN